NQVAQVLDAPELLAANVVDFARNEVVGDVRQGGNEIVDIHEDAVISEIDVVRQPVQRTIREQANDAAIVVVILSGTVCIEEAKTHHWNAESLLKVHHLDFIHPLRHGIVVMLDDRVVQRNIFGQYRLVLVAVNLRRRRKNQFEAGALLDLQNV